MFINAESSVHNKFHQNLIHKNKKKRSSKKKKNDNKWGEICFTLFPISEQSKTGKHLLYDCTRTFISTCTLRIRK